MERSNVRYSVEHRNKAKKEGKFLFTVDLNGIAGKQGGQITCQGCVDNAAEQRLVRNLIRRLVHGEKKGKK